MASHKGSMQTSSKSEPEPFWPALSARLAHAASGPHAAPNPVGVSLLGVRLVRWLVGMHNIEFYFYMSRPILIR